MKNRPRTELHEIDLFFTLIHQKGLAIHQFRPSLYFAFKIVFSVRFGSGE